MQSQEARILKHKIKCFASNISWKFLKLNNIASSNKANVLEFNNHGVKTHPFGYGFPYKADKTVCIVKIRRLTWSKCFLEVFIGIEAILEAEEIGLDLDLV